MAEKRLCISLLLAHLEAWFQLGNRQAPRLHTPKLCCMYPVAIPFQLHIQDSITPHHTPPSSYGNLCSVYGISTLPSKKQRSHHSTPGSSQRAPPSPSSSKLFQDWHPAAEDTALSSSKSCPLLMRHLNPLAYHVRPTTDKSRTILAPNIVII